MNPFHNKVVDVVVYEQIKKEIREAREKIYQKYKDKLKDIKEKEEGMVGFDVFEMGQEDLKILKEDEDLKEMFNNVQSHKLVTRQMVKKAFKDLLNEVLDSDTHIIENGQPKSKKMLLAEMVVDGTLSGTITANQLRGLEVIRDTIGEKPANEIISKGIQQKVIDVKITEEKIERVKNILDGLRSAKVTDGLGENIAIRTVDAGRGDEGVVEVDLPRESKGLHNPDVLPDKQD
ncbi:MAG: hypothetical protein SPL29_05790 [Bacteroidales bacterium]|nr:hypothetical protein [Bacteroidales bacterium]